VAGFLNVSPTKLLNRGATEALQALIGGYNKLKPGDTVLYADLDYSEMKNAMRWLEVRRGVKAVKLTFPEPASDRPLQEADILGFYEKALSANPGTKLLLLTHLNNWTGLIIPVARIAKMARDRGVDVILDAAHSVGQVETQPKGTWLRFHRRQSAQMGGRANRLRRHLYQEGPDQCDRPIHGKIERVFRH
jgi:selenocysteine lyase/cysteine desulfurase